MAANLSLSAIGLESVAEVHRNLSPVRLIEHALKSGEGVLAESGALRVTTGKNTGRSPNDKFVVDDPEVSDQIWWGDVNRPIQPEAFERLYQKVIAHLQDRPLSVFDGFAGADPEYRLPIRVVNEIAWHNHFAHQLFVRPSEEELAN
ncbi:MAG: phosphoenolpyruvate carboxykinase (ATP), partial [Acidobacteria bacterium]|nr:phosphoenolpyruvate carboxykinase (ATP) [Acidobacteriota bacterium]